jgi:hypothetical protein
MGRVRVGHQPCGCVYQIRECVLYRFTKDVSVGVVSMDETCGCAWMSLSMDDMGAMVTTDARQRVPFGDGRRCSEGGWK